MQSTSVLPTASCSSLLGLDSSGLSTLNASLFDAPSLTASSPIQNRRSASHRQPLTISTRTLPINPFFSPSFGPAFSPSFSPSGFRSLGIHSAGRTRTTARLTKFSSRSPSTPASKRSSSASVKSYRLSPGVIDVRRRSASSSINKSPTGRPKTPLPMSSYASIAQTRSISPEIVVLYDEESYINQRAVRNSECCLSLGIIDSYSLPFTIGIWPSPPCSPNPSPITTLFPPIVIPQDGLRRSNRLGSDVSVDSLERTHCRQRYQTTASPGRSKYQSWSAKRAPKETKEDRARRKTAEERKRRTEAARPLPYSKKLEIDEFFGDKPSKERKLKRRTSTPLSSTTKTCTTLSSKQASRNVGSGSQVDHVSEDGTVWLDVEEEQEWTWLISEKEKDGQALPYWPQTFTSHFSTVKHTSAANMGATVSPPLSPLSTTFERPSIDPVKRSARKIHSRSISHSFTTLADPFEKDNDWHMNGRTRSNPSPALFTKIFCSEPIGVRNEKTQSQSRPQDRSKSYPGTGWIVSDEKIKKCKDRPTGPKVSFTPSLSSSSSSSSSSTSPSSSASSAPASLSLSSVPGGIDAINTNVQEPASLPIVKTSSSTSTSASSQKDVGQRTPSCRSDTKESLSINNPELRLADQNQVESGGSNSDERSDLENQAKSEKHVPVPKGAAARSNGSHAKFGFKSALRGFLKTKGVTNSG